MRQGEKCPPISIRKKCALPIARHAISDVRKCSVGSVLRFLRIRH
jgi:hypothetical protein